MTTLLKEAFEKASQLSEADQNQLAQKIIEELESEARWSEAFERSQQKLHALGKKAIEDMKAGRGEHIGVDQL